MNQEAKQKWITALRSGLYTQGKCSLKNTDNTYCCLGVLVEVFEEYHGLKFDQQLNSSMTAIAFGSFDSVASLPELVAKWIGITPKHQILLMNLNDKHGCSFEGIANLLEHLD